jgi:HIP---CoA ligase
LDAAGYVRVTDRKKDVFIVGGFNAYPAEIEAKLARHPAIGQVAVVGVPDERLGEVGVAFVVPAPGQAVDQGDVISFARETMANFKVPRHVIVVSELPMSTSLKVLKDVLRQQARDLTVVSA